ncbi:DUF6748 domain-containing protein [Nannocystis pusilla]|uniref:DUF6748 domain-containing protein n=1 Tax=Nannocystis pusilla TaxID=889268 RepID=UPI003B7D9742
MTRRDERECEGLLCGGFSARRVDHDTAVCGDGSRRRECPVGVIDLSALGLEVGREQELRAAIEDGRALVRGTLARQGALIVSEGWFGRTGPRRAAPLSPQRDLRRLRASRARSRTRIASMRGGTP